MFGGYNVSISLTETCIVFTVCGGVVNNQNSQFPAIKRIANIDGLLPPYATRGSVHLSEHFCQE